MQGKKLLDIIWGSQRYRARSVFSKSRLYFLASPQTSSEQRFWLCSVHFHCSPDFLLSPHVPLLFCFTPSLPWKLLVSIWSFCSLPCFRKPSSFILLLQTAPVLYFSYFQVILTTIKPQHIYSPRLDRSLLVAKMQTWTETSCCQVWLQAWHCDWNLKSM